MNVFDNVPVSKQSFSWADITGTDKWSTWTPVFGSLTVIGATSYSGRYRIVGKQCFFQVRLSAVTSIASVAGTDYLRLPLTAAGYSGAAIMSNDTANTSVGVCHIDVATSRCYLPAQLASADVFNLAGWFEV